VGSVRTVADTRVAQQWSPRNEQPAEQVRANSQDQGWWRCEEGHEWSARIAGRTSRASGCPYCSGRRRIVGVNDFATLHPDLARRWHPENTVDPATVGPRSNRRVRWLCADGHEWTAPVSSLTAGHGCPFCARRTASAGINDLVTTHRDLVTEWDDAELAPTAVTSGSSRKAWWRCRTCAHRWQATVVSRAHSGTGCPRCGTRRAAEKRARPLPGHALADAFPADAGRGRADGGSRGPRPGCRDSGERP
jgi:translation initiation factor IF-1